MVRCDDFYRKWQKAGNFCEKHPSTAARIDAYLDMMRLLEKHDVSYKNVSEHALRPLIRETDQRTVDLALDALVKLVDSRRDSENPSPVISCHDVKNIVREIKGISGWEKHHLDWDRRNNSPSNLFVCDVNTHRILHAEMHQAFTDLYRRGIIKLAEGHYRIDEGGLKW